MSPCHHRNRKMPSSGQTPMEIPNSAHSLVIAWNNLPSAPYPIPLGLPLSDNKVSFQSSPVCKVIPPGTLQVLRLIVTGIPWFVPPLPHTSIPPPLPPPLYFSITNRTTYRTNRLSTDMLHGQELSHGDAERGESLRKLIPIGGLQVPLHIREQLRERFLKLWSVGN